MGERCLTFEPEIFIQCLEHFVKFVVISNVETNNNLLEGVELPMNLQSIIPWKKEGAISRARAW